MFFYWLLATDYWLLSFVPLVEAFARLPAELPFGDQAPQDVGRAEALGAEPVVQVLGDVEAHVKADEIGQAERPHRVIVTEFHRRIYTFRVGDALLHHPHRLQPQRHAQTRRGEARHVPHHYRLLLHPHGDGARGLDHFRHGRATDDDLDQPHDVDGVEEVEADDARGAARAFGDLRDRERRGVGGEDEIFGGEAFDLAQRLALEFEPFGHGLDVEVCAGCVFEPGRRADV